MNTFQARTFEIELINDRTPVEAPRRRAHTSVNDYSVAQAVYREISADLKTFMLSDWASRGAIDTVSDLRRSFVAMDDEWDNDLRQASIAAKLSSHTERHVRNTPEQSDALRRLQFMLTTTRRVRARLTERAGVSAYPLICPWWIMALLVGFAIALAYASQHGILEYENEDKYAGFVALLGLVTSVTMLCRGVRPVIVFVCYLCVLSFFDWISKKELLGGFMKVGAWIPQLMLVNIKAIKDSGLLNRVLEVLLIRSRGLTSSQPTWKSSIIQLYCAAMLLAAILGAGPTIAIAAPIVTRWAEEYGFPLKPVLWVLVVSANVGNVMFVTSAPISISIMEITCGDEDDEWSGGMLRQSPLALFLAVPLGVYACLANLYMNEHLSPFTSHLSASETGKIDSAPASEYVEQDCEAELGEEDLENSKLFYCIDFVVEKKSVVVNKTPRQVGIRREDGLQIVRITRSVQTQEMYRRRLKSFAAHEDALEVTNEWHQATSSVEISNWLFQGGDVMTVRCSTAGVVALRANIGLYALEGLQCHLKLGGRRHQRRLFECVVCDGSPLVGRTLNQLQGWPRTFDVEIDTNVHRSFSFLVGHHGYPLGGWRRSERSPNKDDPFASFAEQGTSTMYGSCLERGADPNVQPACGTKSGPHVTRPLSSSADQILPGDVLLVDAFEGFPSLEATSLNFSVVAMVPDSQAPRHGRFLDFARGIAAIVLLIVAVVLAQRMLLPLVVSLLFTVVILCFTKALVVQQAMEALNWPLFLVIGSAGGVSAAIQKCGVANAVKRLLEKSHYAVTRLILIVLGQALGNTLSPVAAGLILAPIAKEVLKSGKEPKCNEDVGVLVIMSCNIALCTPYGTPSNALVCSMGGFSKCRFMIYGGIASCITSLVIMIWAWRIDL